MFYCSHVLYRPYRMTGATLGTPIINTLLLCKRCNARTDVHGRQRPQRLCGIFTRRPPNSHNTLRQRPQRLCGIFTHDGKTRATHTTAMAATIAEFSHESHQTHATHYGNGRNDYAEFSHEGHQTRATHYGNGRNDPTKTRATHTTATAATIMRNFRTVSTQNPSGKNRLKYLVL